MSGRAGRRGLDERGIVIMIVDEKLEPEIGKSLLKVILFCCVKQPIVLVWSNVIYIRCRCNPSKQGKVGEKAARRSVFLTI